MLIKINVSKSQVSSSRYCVDHTCPHTDCNASKSSRSKACKTHINDVRTTNSTVMNPLFENDTVDESTHNAVDDDVDDDSDDYDFDDDDDSFEC